MKFINKMLLVALLIGFGTACNNTDLDLLDDPNAITPDKASVNDLYNNIQLSFAAVYNYAEYIPGGVARMYNAGNFTYNAYATPQTFNNLWGSAYEDLLPDVDALLAIADEKGFDIHGGTAKIMEAYTMMVLVDLFDKVPYSQATQGIAVISPSADEGAAIYAAAGALLDDAIKQMTGTNAPSPASDIFYDGDAAKWITFANTLKLKAALNQRLTDPSGAAATINAVVAGGDFIDEAGEDFQFNYGSQRNNPQSRHPFYVDLTVENSTTPDYGYLDRGHYETNDGDYLSNYYMWLMRADKETAEGVTIIDPRIRYYFYRKVEKADEQDPTTYSCHFSALPDQSAQPDYWEALAGDDRLPYCIVLPGDGYSGRDHLNGEGIPPDGPTRTSYGLYPAGGQFDINLFEDTRQAGTTGGRGAGILPIVLSSFVDFMRAEAALTIGTSDDARALLESGIRASMTKVVGFESLVPGTINSTLIVRGVEVNVKEAYSTTPEDVDAYVAFVLEQYDAAGDSGKLDIVIKEYYIAAWGNGLEAYNMYRRTGYPKNMQPGLDPEVGAFPRSFLLPADHVTRNINAVQRTQSDRVFWDDGSANVY